MLRSPLAPVPLAGLLLVLPAPALAQEYVLTVDPVASSVVVATSAGVDLPGTVIGDHDPRTNPTGTRTLPGLFGPTTGNEPIDVDFGLAIEADFDGAPTGGFSLAIDTNALTVAIDGLDLDLLGGAAASAALVLSTEYETFRTFDPNSLYVGGFPIDVPLGTQDLSNVVVAQTGPGLGALVPTKDPDVYSFLAGVPVDLSLDVAGLLTGDTPIGPVPLVLPVGGTLTLDGAQATVAFDFDLDEVQSLEDPGAGFTFEDVPLPLPTILPPGGTANLLFTTSIASLDVDLFADVTLVATGEAKGGCGFSTYCPATANTSGLPGVLTAVGLPTLAAQTLTLEASQLPMNQFGYLIASPTQDFVPFFEGGDGNLCLGTPLSYFRSLVQTSGFVSTMSFPIDFDDLPRGTVFLPGSTWNFQVWFRDVGDAPAHNTTHAVQVAWCP
jgi:hypothetical protein